MTGVFIRGGGEDSGTSRRGAAPNLDLAASLTGPYSFPREMAFKFLSLNVRVL